MLRATAGLPNYEEIFSISPFSDDEDDVHSAIKSEQGRVLPKKDQRNSKEIMKQKACGKKKQGSLIRTSPMLMSILADFESS